MIVQDGCTVVPNLLKEFLLRHTVIAFFFFSSHGGTQASIAEISVGSEGFKGLYFV